MERSLVLEAERLVYVTTLVAQHLANPCSLDLEQLELRQLVRNWLKLRKV